MQIVTMKIKLFGKVSAILQVVDAAGEVLQVLESKEEAQAWINSK